MHFSVLLIHEMDENSIMAKRNCDATEEDGANIEFNVELTEKEAMQEYEKAIKEDTSLINMYPDLPSYMESMYSYLELQDGEYGSNHNAGSMYDWYEVGGRWKGCLPSSKNEKELKALVKQALNLKNKDVKEKFRDKADEYVQLSSMPVLEACRHLKIGGQDEMLIEKGISAQYIIDWFKHITKEWSNDNNEPKDAVRSLFGNIIIEEDGQEEEYLEGDENINEEFFTEKYNYFLKKNLKEGRAFQITVLDLHM